MTLTFNPLYILLGVGIVVHLVYAAVTHYHKLRQLRAYLRGYNDNVEKSNSLHKSYRKVDGFEFVGPALLTFLIGLETKIVEIVVYGICKVVGTVIFAERIQPWDLKWHESPDVQAVSNRLTKQVGRRPQNL